MVGPFIASILRVRELRPENVKKLALGHTVHKEQIKI